MTEKLTKKAYRDPALEGVDEELYEKALAIKRLSVMGCNIKNFGDYYGWKVSASRSSTPISSPDQALTTAIDSAYKGWFEAQAREWDEISKEAVAYALLDPSETTSCPHISVEKHEVESLARYFDAIVKHDIEIDESVLDNKKWIIECKTPYVRMHVSDDKSMIEGLEDFEREIKKTHESDREEVRVKALKLGILENSKAIVKVDPVIEKKRRKIKFAITVAWILFVMSGSVLALI